MRISTIGYVIKQGFKNIGRNMMFSLASIATMSACIFLFGLFFSILFNFQYIIKSAEEGVAITVFFEDGITQAQIDNIGQALRGRDDVSDVKYVSADDAWNEFKTKYFGENEELADGFRNDNPLASSSNYEVYMKTLEDDGEISLLGGGKSLSTTQQELVRFAGSLDGVRSVKKSDLVANMLSSVNVLVAYISVAIILILFGVSIFLISNTVTIGISVRKEEINIMKYIGATDFFVRAPFVLEGILIGLIGAAIPLWGIHYAYDSVLAYTTEKFSMLTHLLQFLPSETVFGFLTPVCLGVGVGIGFIGSFSTVRKHLHV